jgi:hypothetical protein
MGRRQCGHVSIALLCAQGFDEVREEVHGDEQAAAL